MTRAHATGLLTNTFTPGPAPVLEPDRRRSASWSRAAQHPGICPLAQVASAGGPVRRGGHAVQHRVLVQGRRGTDWGASPRACKPILAFGANWVIPVLIAAVDPAAEANLDGLNHAVVSGGYLTENKSRRGLAGQQARPPFPVLASSSTGMDEYALTRGCRSSRAAGGTAPGQPKLGMTRQETAARPDAGHRAGRPRRSRPTRSCSATMGQRRRRPEASTFPRSMATGASGRRVTGAPRAAGWTPLLVRNPLVGLRYAAAGSPTSPWTTRTTSIAAIHRSRFPRPISTPAGRARRPSHAWSGSSTRPGSRPSIRSRGCRSGAYEPVNAAPASAASRKALHGSDLLPNQNLGGYVSQPVQPDHDAVGAARAGQHRPVRPETCPAQPTRSA